jgi:hypothetical protein
MTHFQGHIKTNEVFSFGRLNPFSSPAFVLATSGIVALVWAFQQHGWSFCIPCVVFIVRKIAGVGREDVQAWVRRTGAFVQNAAGALPVLRPELSLARLN